MSGHARTSDPATSHDAAQAVTGCEPEILALYNGDDDRTLTDDEIAALLPRRYPPTVKTARSRLTNADEPLLVDSGLRRKSNRGRDMIAWKLAPRRYIDRVTAPVVLTDEDQEKIAALLAPADGQLFALPEPNRTRSYG